MRYFKFFILILLVTFSCYEAFYNDSTYQYYFGDNDFLSSPTKYKIKGDTLFAYRKEDSKEKVNINFIEKNDDKLFILEMGVRKTRYISIDSSEYTMNKIRGGKDFEKFHKAYLSRKYALIRKGIVKKDGW